MKSERSIYIVDDDEDDRMIMRAALEEIVENVHIVEVRSGHDLINLLDSENEDKQPKLILMDMNMPRMSGLEALSLVRSRLDRRHIPVIMISTSSNQQQISNAYQQGINAYVTKPVSISEYAFIAEAINVCFLNNDPSLGEVKNHIRSFRNKSILVIEDNQDQWDLMHVSLKQSMPDANLLHIKDIESTLDFLKSDWQTAVAPVRMILLDLYLPTREHGLILLDHIRKFLNDNHFSSVPIIIFSGSDHNDDIKTCYRHHANIYIVKPNNMKKTFAYFQNLNLLIRNSNIVSGQN